MEEAVKEVVSQLTNEGQEPILLLFFSNHENFWFYSSELKKRFSNTQTVGTTSNCIFCSQGSSDFGLSAIGIFSGIDIATGCVFEVNKHPNNYINHVQQALEHFESYENTICLEFTSSVKNGEELVLDTLVEKLSPYNIPIVGSSSDSAPLGEQTLVSLNGDIYCRTCVFILIKNLNGKIAQYKESIYKPVNGNFTATEINCDEGIVYKFNNQRAQNFLEDRLRSKSDNRLKHMQDIPIGRSINNQLCITQTEKFYEDGSISYLGKIFCMTKLYFLENEDLQQVWKRTVTNTKKMIENPSFTLAIHCAAQTKKFKLNNVYSDFLQNLNENYGPYIGVCGQGQQIDNVHQNHCLVLVIFE